MKQDWFLGILNEYSKIFNEKNNEIKNHKSLTSELKQLTNEIPLPIIKIDKNGKYSYMNNAAWGAKIEETFRY